MKINYNNLRCMFLKRNINTIFKEVILEHNLPENVSCNVTLVSEEEIQRLNREYRNIDKVTDVLSFPLIENGEYKSNIDRVTNLIDLGDVVICNKVAKKQAKALNHSYKREICFLALHSFLHLIGYDHIEKCDEEKMIEMQNKILNKLDIKR